MPLDRKEHWESIYRTKAPDEVSWYQAHPATSLRLIETAGVGKDQRIIDVGGGASVLADCLLDAGFQHLAVLDISRAALNTARARLGERARQVDWIEADLMSFEPSQRYDLWHDRAVFHFLTDPADRRKYVDTLHRALQPGGHVIIAAFAPDGPPRCSGLEVVRYDGIAIAVELGYQFRLVQQLTETHRTPWGDEQAFAWFRFCMNAPV